MASETGTFTNRLATARSPYLLQHRHNPVDWWEWSPEAFAEARRTHRPVLLSVGYAACHWCHVMAYESFENPATAAVMNSLFVNIKVDREERPDVDQVYMSALHALGEPGGWPLTMFLTPEGEPFWGGTYFPPQPRWGKPGFADLLRHVARVFGEQPAQIRQNADALGRALAAVPTPRNPQQQDGQPRDWAQVTAPFPSVFDPGDGGLKGAPKFPNPMLLETLARRAASEGDTQARELLHRSLDRMAEGGIHDHVAGGFARYSVDAEWLVPHFEKMLYDNALLLRLYALEAARTGDPVLRSAAHGIVNWLAKEMRQPGGAFAASLDADSEGEEGRFYVWTAGEIEAVLGPEDAARFGAVYDVRPGGNWEGRVILNRLRATAPPPPDDPSLARMRAQLLAARAARVRPGLDDKILADWNGLAIRALADAAGWLGRPDWLELAANAFDFVSESMRDPAHADGLAHAERQGGLVAPGFALDHAAMGLAALVLDTAQPGERSQSRRQAARRWADHLWENYRDPDTGLLRMTRLDASDLPAPPRHTHDDAVPNANGVYAELLLRLAAMTGEEADERRARDFLAVARRHAEGAALAHGSIVNAWHFDEQMVEVVCAGPDAARFRQAALAVPHLSLVLREVATAEGLPAGHPAAAQLAAAGTGAAFVCRKGRCLPPVRDPVGLPEAILSA